MIVTLLYTCRMTLLLRSQSTHQPATIPQVLMKLRQRRCHHSLPLRTGREMPCGIAFPAADFRQDGIEPSRSWQSRNRTNGLKTEKFETEKFFCLKFAQVFTSAKRLACSLRTTWPLVVLYQTVLSFRVF